MKVIALFVLSLASIYALDNGVALTPPMGWMSWERFRCEVDCVKHPDTCISEKLIVETIDHIVDDGYLAAGYNYVNIDDCWESMERDEQGRLFANVTRFPHGMKWLVEYANNKGVKLGTYTDYGTLTCGGYPGTKGYVDIDAKTFEEWGIENLKVDGCYCDKSEYREGYTNLSHALVKANPPIVYACSWPAYDKTVGNKELQQLCNVWRNYGDITSAWWCIIAIIDEWARNETYYAVPSGPGHWTDPDMLLVGNPGEGLTNAAYRTQMALWAIFAAPLYMGNDVRNITEEARAILLNKEIIDIDQDPVGIAGRRFYHDDEYDVWMKPLSNDEYAVALMNRKADPKEYVFDPHYVPINFAGKKIVLHDCWTHQDVATLSPGEKFTVKGLEAHDTAIYRIRIVN